MTPQQQLAPRRQHPAIISQKVQITYKLFLLENARTAFEQELFSFTNEAYEEVQGFFKSSCPTSVFSDLANVLDTKRNVIEKLLGLFKDLTDVCVKNGMRANQHQPLADKGILMTDVLKFGPMLLNSFKASSIAKAVQVLGPTFSPQQLKHFPISQPAAVQQNDMICGISSSYNAAVVSTGSSPHLKAEDREQAVVFEEKHPPDAPNPPPTIIQSPKVSAERPPLLLPPIQPIFPEISNPKPMKITPLISWGCESDVQVQHQKQTSSQLLHFLREKAKNMGALEVTVMECSKSMHTSFSPLSKPPSIKTQSYQFRHVTDDLINAQPPKTLSADIENQVPIFRVKRVESSGSLTYTCVIATKTELWDIGDIFTEVGRGDSGASPSEETDRRSVTTEKPSLFAQENHWKTPTLQSTTAEDESRPDHANPPTNGAIAIPEFQIRRFDETEVVVSHIVSPGDFYIQQADSVTKLQALISDSWKASSSYAEQNCIPDIGTKVMGWFPKQEQWCRVEVTKICGVSGDNNAADGPGRETSITVEVRRLDHGDKACVSLWNIKELTPEMAALPLQAVQVSLANVTPVNESDWSAEAVDWFQAMVHNRTLYARLYPQGPKITAELFLEKGKLGAMRRGASLSLRLAQNGHAKHKKLKNGLVKKSAVQVKMRQQDAKWEKYLISCYTQRQ